MTLGLGACQKEKQVAATTALSTQVLDLHFVNHRHEDTPPPEDNEEPDGRWIRPGQNSPAECDPVPQFFIKQVWESSMRTTCHTCHRPGGYATNAYTLKGKEDENWLSHNFNIDSNTA